MLFVPDSLFSRCWKVLTNLITDKISRLIGTLVSAKKDIFRHV